MNEKVIKHLSEAQLALARAAYYGENDMAPADVMMIRQCLNRIPEIIEQLENEKVEITTPFVIEANHET